MTEERDETQGEVDPEAPAVDQAGERTEATAVSTADEAAPDEAVPDVAAEASPTAAETPAEAPAPPVAQSGPKPKRKRLPRSERRQRPKKVRASTGERKPIVRLPKPDDERGRRQERQGTVVSDKMDKTIVVDVQMVKAHPKYKKVVRRSVKFHAHDEGNRAGIGDVVRIVETRPLSATKRWRLAEIVEAAK